MINELNRRWWVLAGVSIVSFLGCIDLTIVNTAAASIGTDLRASITELQLIVNIFVVALSMFMVTAGRLADRFGRRRVLYLGSTLFGIASLAAGFASNVPLLVVCRFLQGSACAVLYTSSATIVSDAFPQQQRGRAIGTLFAVNGIGLAAGPVLGGVIVAAMSWHWVFWINVPLVALALAVCGFNLAESPGKDDGAPLDWPGLALLVVGLSGVLFAITFNDTFGRTSWQIVGTFVVGMAALVTFVMVERAVAAPIVPFGLLRHRLFLTAVICEFGLGFFYPTPLLLTPLYLAGMRHDSPAQIGLWMLATTATVAVLSLLVGRVVERTGPIPVLAAGFAAFSGSALLQSQFTATSGVGHLVVALTAMGAGWACVLGPSAVAALTAVPERLCGLAVGATWTFHNVGGAIGLGLGMTLFRRFAGNSLTVAAEGTQFTAGHRAAMLMLVTTSTAALVAVLAQRNKLKTREHPAIEIDQP